MTLPIMLALCSMLLGTYYAQNYASIIGVYDMPVSFGIILSALFT